MTREHPNGDPELVPCCICSEPVEVPNFVREILLRANRCLERRSVAAVEAHEVLTCGRPACEAECRKRMDKRSARAKAQSHWDKQRQLQLAIDGQLGDETPPAPLPLFDEGGDDGK